MTRAYSDPSRESDEHALPNIETFYMDVRDFVTAGHDTWMAERTMDLDPSPFSNLTDCSSLAGWYYWYCLPMCLPDSEAIGPFTSEKDALADAQENQSETTPVMGLSGAISTTDVD